MEDQEAPQAGLVTVRFESMGVGLGPRWQPPAGAVRRACLFAVQDAPPDQLAWYETRRYVQLDTALTGENAGAVEYMSFRLHRAAQSSTGRLEDCRWLYVVHTDIPDDVSQEYNTWYDQEHLPRLVQVPGIVRARRYVAPDQAPRYLTAYELTDPDAFSSPAGLQARKTPWTARMRSLFFNTRRYTGLLMETG